MRFIGGGVPKFELLGTPAREFPKTWNLVSIEDTYRATGKKMSKEFVWKILRKVSYKKGHFCLQTTILRRVPKFELPGTPPREFSKTWNLVSIEDTYRATGKKMLKEIRLKNFEKSIVQKITFAYKRPYWDGYQSSSSRVPHLGSIQRD